MKKNRLAAGALAFAVSITACGCGEQVYEMTNEEEAAVVHYSAHAVTKFNKRQSEGIKDVALLKAMMEQQEKEAEERKEQEEQEQQQQQAQQQEEEKKPADSTAAPSEESDSKAQEKYVSLGKALGLSGVDAVYRGYELVSAYQASQSYMVRANSGNELLVVHVNLKNGGSKTAECNILSKMPSFRLTVNGELNVNADTTILLNDLGTYQGRIKAGKKAQTVLIFQVKKGSVKSIDTMEMEVTVNGSGSKVQLER
ncbi:MAG: DUF4352 domain-containing protein [Eubacterium sp.]|nr:DUF4352 domain-containing protein [Eubacterium sp.]